MAGCTWFGWQQANGYPRRIKQLMQLQTAFRLLEAEITYGLTPLPAALQRVNQQTEPWLQAFFQAVAQEMTSGHHTLAEAWAAQERLLRDTSLLDKDLQLLSSSCCNLGQGDLEAQKKVFALLHQRLSHGISEAQQDCRQQETLWRYLGLSAGAVLVLILI